MPIDRDGPPAHASNLIFRGRTQLISIGNTFKFRISSTSSQQATALMIEMESWRDGYKYDRSFTSTLNLEVSTTSLFCIISRQHRQSAYHYWNDSWNTFFPTSPTLSDSDGALIARIRPLQTHLAFHGRGWVASTSSEDLRFPQARSWRRSHNDCLYGRCISNSTHPYHLQFWRIVYSRHIADEKTYPSGRLFCNVLRRMRECKELPTPCNIRMTAKDLLHSFIGGTALQTNVGILAHPPAPVLTPNAGYTMNPSDSTGRFQPLALLPMSEQRTLGRRVKHWVKI
ncbi:hypothetical protein BDN72DRAFT_882395, partial [Pluteus cervinus]